MVNCGIAVPEVHGDKEPDGAAEHHPVRADRQEVELPLCGCRFL